MYCRLSDFKVDVGRLQEHFVQHVVSRPPIQYKDNQVSYVGWAVTSRDGTLEDGVRRLSKTTGTGVRGVKPTGICSGYLAKVMNDLTGLGIKPYRARIMRMESEGAEMGLHTDADKEAWRLHIPIFTNPDSFFEWEREDGTIESVNLPADGSAWVVRVDIRHRAVNRSPNPSLRVHLLMGMGNNPEPQLLAEPWLLADTAKVG
jgi:hypothetical protein